MNIIRYFDPTSPGPNPSFVPHAPRPEFTAQKPGPHILLSEKTQLGLGDGGTQAKFLRMTPVKQKFGIKIGT